MIQLSKDEAEAILKFLPGDMTCAVMVANPSLLSAVHKMVTHVTDDRIRFDVGGDKVNAIVTWRYITHMGLKESKDEVDAQMQRGNTIITLPKGVTQAKAEEAVEEMYASRPTIRVRWVK